MRILIAGVPRAGKTTLANSLQLEHGIAPLHTDSLIGLGWPEASAAAALWIAKPGPWIIEGVSVGRALRKWLAANSGKPADAIYWMPFHCVPLTRGQSSMASGCITVWSEMLPELSARGVRATTVDSRRALSL